MKKIINPCTCDIGEGFKYNAFAEIVYNEEDCVLSIHGVIGPMKNGNSKGSCGQCIDEFANGTPKGKWTREMLDKFCKVWREWHLNDMRAYCQHMKELGWTEHINESIEVKTWNLKKEAYTAKTDARNRAIRCLENGEAFNPTDEEVMYANLPFSVKTYNGETPQKEDLYEFKETDCLGYSNVEYVSRGWLSFEDTPLGFLKKPCPVCGYKYGTAWIKEEIPRDVITFLEQLPESDIAPAWV